MERSFLFWLPRSTPSTSVQSILDFRPPQTICHAYSRLPAGFNGSGMRLPTKAQAVDIVRFGWCEMFSSRSYRRRTAFRSYQQSTHHRPHKLPCHRPHAVAAILNSDSKMPASTGQYGSQCGSITMRYSIIHSQCWLSIATYKYLRTRQ
mgnify:FL=1